MAIITFPHAVKVEGAFYKAGQHISVEDAAEYAQQGATVISQSEEVKPEEKPEEAPPKRTRRARK